ncbi:MULTISPECIES: non-hydrolyzing UDP-N-acetylglucosamine 2-epimerase [unclassified Polaribacter]|uniref:non-hydrolyzing UDP-N-acetylglucosamine 2-epimerase n=1 Tax=unclassified Polaribacter TaxID=196858 RepID=UPI0011BF3033|nr:MULTISPECIES: UDP-N-acetylglucosamine 2-epimerase (non-hydrolyzing) [unclassified Polaribacter]TXD54238.1 UDP-N-acetylglucosamine 2-epimerase (non-hydrolyzing) [Polaribacter sp. IC063]TXD57120.1 UDP-N-acetylglucosamine 2-epimerase (non-hydrolyzing) [Polaribacter sp. IC066]
MKKKVLIVFGTRPEAIKMALVIKEFQKNPDKFNVRVCITAQHREMLDQVLNFFDIIPFYDLDLMKPNQNLYSLTAQVITNLKPILEDFKPDFVFVHGDTTTAMAGSIAGFYSEAKVCHVEAGLRTFNLKSPFPEEMNRTVIGAVSNIHFAPTVNSRQNLIKENKNEGSIIVTGNTVIDALLYSVSKVNSNFKDSEIEFLKNIIKPNRKLILVTGHRRENHGQGFLNICEALKQIANKNKDCDVFYPVHLNPNVQEPVYKLLNDVVNIKLLKPLSYPAFVWLMAKSFLIITDSGGVQEEAPSLGKPVLLMRDTTERPEAVEAGTVILVGTDTNRIVAAADRLLNNSEAYLAMSKLHNPYGDGNASKKIINYILDIS